MKKVQESLGISYPTANKRLDDLLSALGLGSDEKILEEEPDLSLFQKHNTGSTKASDIIRNKIYENGGKVTVYSLSGKPYVIRADRDGRSFLCAELPIKPALTYDIFDVIVDLLTRQGGSARKGLGRNSPLGEGGCTEDTVVGAIGKYYFKASSGKYVFDPVFVLAAVLDWAGIAHNKRGYITLTASYLATKSQS